MPKQDCHAKRHVRGTSCRAAARRGVRAPHRRTASLRLARWRCADRRGVLFAQLQGRPVGERASRRDSTIPPYARHRRRRRCTHESDRRLGAGRCRDRHGPRPRHEYARRAGWLHPRAGRLGCSVAGEPDAQGVDDRRHGRLHGGGLVALSRAQRPGTGRRRGSGYRRDRRRGEFRRRDAVTSELSRRGPHGQARSKRLSHEPRCPGDHRSQRTRRTVHAAAPEESRGRRYRYGRRADSRQCDRAAP